MATLNYGTTLPREEGNNSLFLPFGCNINLSTFTPWYNIYFGTPSDSSNWERVTSAPLLLYELESDLAGPFSCSDPITITL